MSIENDENYTGCLACGAEGCNCYVEELPLESVDVQIDRISERIEIAEIANKVLRERIDLISAKLDVLERITKDGY
jgi:hypothetical protein